MIAKCKKKLKNARAKMRKPTCKAKIENTCKAKKGKTHVQRVQMISLLDMQICEVLVGVADTS